MTRSPLTVAREAVARAPWPEPEPNELVAGEHRPLVTCRSQDVAAVLLVRRRGSDALSAHILLLEQRDGKWQPIAQADDTWAPPPAQAPHPRIAWMGWVASERDQGAATAIWGTADPPIARVAVASPEHGAACEVTRRWRAFVTIALSDGPAWYDVGERTLRLVGATADGTQLVEETVQAY